jgi:hypothetical protein
MSVLLLCRTGNHKRIGIDMKILSVLFRLKWYMGSVDAQKISKAVTILFVC